MIRIPPVSEHRSPVLSEVSRFEGFMGSRTYTERNQTRGSPGSAKRGISPQVAGHAETDSALLTPSFNARRATSHVEFVGPAGRRAEDAGEEHPADVDAIL